MPWSSWHGGVQSKVGLNDLVKVFTVKMDEAFLSYNNSCPSNIYIPVLVCLMMSLQRLTFKKNSLLHFMFLYPDHFLTPP